MSKKTAVNGASLGASERTSAGLRDALFDELDALRNGKSNPGRANATAKLCATVIESVRMEIEVRRYAASSKAPGDAVKTLGNPIPLSA